jgi:class 3 adenylate cyclase
MKRHAAALLLGAGLLIAVGAAPARAQLLPQPVLDSESFTLGDPQIYVDWMNVIYDRVAADALSAPAGARVYAYAGITAYEALVPFMPDNRSLSFQLNGLGDLPLPDFPEDLSFADYIDMYDQETVVNAAMYSVALALFRDKTNESREAFVALRDQWLESRLAAGISQEEIDLSIVYGDLLGKAIGDWMNGDNYIQIRERDPYVLPSEHDSDYRLTAEASQPAEPYWGDLRSMVLPYETVCWQAENYAYSEQQDSDFYRQAFEVFEAGNNLTPEQRAIAEWWVDTPSLTGTPAGHWVQIMNQLVTQLDLDMGRAAEMYAMVGMVLGDSFISTWGQKYVVNLLRPETYINEHISARWRPYIQTPPFPEYPSGHSVVSGAAGDMLTALFGTNVHFVDETHVARGDAPREFFSFTQAANEAAISRLYGGIHYRAAIENGLRSGSCIAITALNNIVLRPVSQGE